MDIPVLLEPTATGWRATTGAPLNLAAEGPDKDAVLADVRAQTAAKLTGGATVVSLSVPVCTLDLEVIDKLTAEIAANPFFDEWVKGIAEYRAEVNVPPDPDEDLYPSTTPTTLGSVVSTTTVSSAAGS